MKINNLIEFEQYIKKLTLGEVVLEQEVDAGPFTAIVEHLRVLKQILANAGGSNDLIVSDLNETLNGMIEQNAAKDAEIAGLNESIEDLNLQIQGNINEIQSFSQLLSSNLADLGRGYFAIGKDLMTLNVFNKKAEELLKVVSLGEKPAWQVLREKEEGCNGWLNLFFDDSTSMTFEDIAEIGPRDFKGHEGKIIHLRYAPMLDQYGVLDAIIVIVMDKTQEHLAQIEKERTERFIQSVGKILKNKDIFINILEDIDKERQRLIDFSKQALLSAVDFDVAIRSFHTLKGGTATFQLGDIEKFCHSMEQTLIEKQKNNDLSITPSQLQEYAETLLTYKKDILKEIEEQVGLKFGRSTHTKEILKTSIEDFSLKLNEHPELKSIYDEIFIKESVESLLTHYNEVVQSVAEKIGKKVLPLEFTNAKYKIDRTKYSALFSSFVHIFRNAVDHGLESAEERVMLGKPEAGKIQIACSVRSSENADYLLIQIRDDGQGINAKRVKKKAIEKGLMSKEEERSEQEIVNLVFQPGFSTKSEVSIISGRGVGLDAVMAEARALGGTVKVTSIDGTGSVFLVAIPMRKNQLKLGAVA